MYMREIYFAGSIRGGREDVAIYESIINYLGSFGKVLTEHIGKKDLSKHGEAGLSDSQIHDRDMAWISDARTIVAEVTQASLGVGYELGRVVERNLWVLKEKRKEILCLYRPQVDKRLSAMINGCPTLAKGFYTNFDEAKKHLDEFFNGLK